MENTQLFSNESLAYWVGPGLSVSDYVFLKESINDAFKDSDVVIERFKTREIIRAGIWRVLLD